MDNLLPEREKSGDSAKSNAGGLKAFASIGVAPLTLQLPGRFHVSVPAYYPKTSTIPKFFEMKQQKKLSLCFPFSP